MSSEPLRGKINDRSGSQLWNRVSNFGRSTLDSLGLRAGREQCWSSQDSVDLQRSSTLAVDTIPL